jgi:uncharacterized protein
MRKPMLLLLSSAVLLLGAFAGLTAVRSYRIARTLFEADPPSAMLKTPERTGVRGLQAVGFSSGQGIRIAAWYVPPQSQPGAAIVVAPGTNSDRSTMLAEIKLLGEAGYGVLAFDWPGLGESTGAVRWDGQARATLESAIDWLAARPEVDPGRIGGLGFSIGGFVMVQVGASDRRLRALVLEAPPADFEDYVQLHFTRWGWLSELPSRLAMQGSGMLGPDIAPVNLIGKVSPRPILLVANSDDPEIPPAMVKRLFSAGREPKNLWVLNGSTHGGYAQIDPVGYPKRIEAFFRAGLTRDSLTQNN